MDRRAFIGGLGLLLAGGLSGAGDRLRGRAAAQEASERVAQFAVYLVADEGTGGPRLPLAEGVEGPVALDTEAVVTGRSVAAVELMDVFGTDHVAFTLREEGARSLGEVTSRNVGRRMALVVGGTVEMVATIHGAITGGAVQVGPFDSRKDAEALIERVREAVAADGGELDAR